MARPGVVGAGISDEGVTPPTSAKLEGGKRGLCLLSQSVSVWRLGDSPFRPSSKASCDVTVPSGRGRRERWTGPSGLVIWGATLDWGGACRKGGPGVKGAWGCGLRGGASACLKSPASKAQPADLSAFSSTPCLGLCSCHCCPFCCCCCFRLRSPEQPGHLRGKRPPKLRPPVR